jgi:hypothetical protein
MENLFGLWKDGRPINAAETYVVWEHAKNILIDKGFKSISNENGFDLKHTFSKSVIGIVPVTTGIVIFTSNNNNDDVYYYDGNTMTALFTDVNLGLRLDKPIEGIFRYASCGDLIVCITDFHNTIKIFNITYILENSPTFNINDYELFPKITRTDVNATVAKNGSLDIGSYSLFYRYKNSQGVTTNTQLVHSPVYINTDNLNEALTTNKSINYLIYPHSDNVNNFEKIEIGVIYTLNKISTAYLITELTVNTIVEFNLTSINESETIPLEEVLVPNVVYTKSKTLATLEDNIYLGNVETAENYDFQKYVNNFKITWTAQVVGVGDEDNPKTFMPREGYAMYFWYTDIFGVRSPFYHIPGRPPLGGETDPQDTFTDTGFSPEPKEYKVIDTASLTFSDAVQGLYRGNMGYWENENETYPSEECSKVYDATGEINDLAGVNVRHHKFPGLTNLYNWASGHSSNFGFEKDIVLGINIDDIYFPPSVANVIDSWGIAYAKRTPDNMLVMGQDLLHYGHKHISSLPDGGPAAPKDMEVSGGLPVNRAVRVYGNPNDVLESVPLTTDYHRGTCPDILQYKPGITPDFIVNEMKLRIDYSGDPIGTFNSLQPVFSNGNLRYPFNYDLCLYDSKGANIVRSSSYPTSITSEVLKKIKDFTYVPNHSMDFANNRQNLFKESFFRYELEIPTDNLWMGNLASQNTLRDDETNFYVNSPNLTKWETSRISYCQLKSDIYLNYKNTRELVVIDNQFITDASQFGIFGGDCYLTTFTHASHVSHSNNLTSTSDYEIRNWYEKKNTINPGYIQLGNLTGYCYFRTAIHSPHNWATRYQDSNDPLTHYYPLTNGLIGNNNTKTIQEGSKDWITLYHNHNTDINTYNSGLVDNFCNDGCNNVFKFRIPKGTRLIDYDSIGWASFFTNDFYDLLTREHGEIWKLIKYNDQLLIHQKYALSVARVKDSIITEVETLYIGRGDVFDRPPGSVALDTFGYTGNQSQWASIVCKLGYCFVDRFAGKVFIYNGTLNEVSNKGLHNELRDKLNLSYNDTDNPFMGEGLTMTFDEKFDRLILAKTLYTPNGEVINVPDITQNIGVQQGDIIKWQGVYYSVVSGSRTEDYHTPDFNGDPSGTFYGIPIDVQESNDFTNKSFTLSYSPNLRKGGGGWVCLHDYYPSHLFSTRDKEYAVLNKSHNGYLFRLNADNKPGIYFEQEDVFSTNVTYASYVDFINNIQKKLEKIVYAVNWDTDVINSFNKVLEKKTFTSIMLYNDNQCTAEVELTNNDLVIHNSRNTNGEWAFNAIRDVVNDSDSVFIDENRDLIDANINQNKSFFDKSLFIGKFVIVRFKYDNVEGNDIYLNSYNVYFGRTKQTDK